MEETLAAFLAHNAARPWQPGHVDCCMVLADWAIWLGHADPASRLRGAYDNDEGFRAIIAAHGDVPALVASCVPTGAISTTSPQRGDIGVIGSPTNIHRQFGAVHDGCGWLVRTPAGFDRVTARTLKAWSIVCHSC